MKMEVIEMTLPELETEIKRLENLRVERTREDYENFIKEAKKNIGRCFKDDKETFIKVIGVPPLSARKSGVNYNPHRYPAFFLTSLPTREDEMPFYYDSIFSGAWGQGNSTLHTYEEITEEEYNKELQKRFDYLKESLS